MCADEFNSESFMDRLRAIADELGQSVDRTINEVDVTEIADAIGVDPQSLKDLRETATGWLHAQLRDLGAEHQPGASKREPEAPKRPKAGPMSDDAFRGAGPHPLDLPTDEQGRALAALDSGRWAIEPGADALAAHGEGPGPSDALGLVRELRARDWISAEGRVTVAGQHALSRWLTAASRL
jgi:hypothetical protein